VASSGCEKTTNAYPNYQADPRTVLRVGDTFYIFNPKINRVEEYDIGKNREMVDQYLELGFNTRGEHLKRLFGCGHR